MNTRAVIWVPRRLEEGVAHFAPLIWQDVAGITIDAGTATVFVLNQEGKAVEWGRTREDRAIGALSSRLESDRERWLRVGVPTSNGIRPLRSSSGYADLTAVERFTDSSGVYGFNCFDVNLVGGVLIGRAVAEDYERVMKLIEASWIHPAEREELSWSVRS